MFIDPVESRRNTFRIDQIPSNISDIDEETVSLLNDLKSKFDSDMTTDVTKSNKEYGNQIGELETVKENTMRDRVQSTISEIDVRTVTLLNDISSKDNLEIQSDMHMDELKLLKEQFSKETELNKSLKSKEEQLSKEMTDMKIDINGYKNRYSNLYSQHEAIKTKFDEQKIYVEELETFIKHQKQEIADISSK